MGNTFIGPVPSIQWRHNEHDCVSNHQPLQCLLNRLFRRRSKKTSKLRVTGLCAGNSPETGEFPAQRASNAESVSIWWRHHAAHWFEAGPLSSEMIDVSSTGMQNIPICWIGNTVKPVSNDHLYDKIYYLWFIQWCVLTKAECTNLLLLTISAFWSSSRWPLAT